MRIDALDKPGARLRLLSVSIGIVYLWFGALKLVPQLSPAEQLAVDTINKLSWDLLPDRLDMALLALWECSLGILLILGVFKRFSAYLFFTHMACTFIPFVLFPVLSLPNPPFGFSLIGQYIAKNIVFIAAGIILFRKPAEPDPA